MDLRLHSPWSCSEMVVSIPYGAIRWIYGVSGERKVSWQLFQSPTGQSGGSTQRSKVDGSTMMAFQSPTGQSGGSTLSLLGRPIPSPRFNPLRGNPVDLPGHLMLEGGGKLLFQSPTGQSGGSTLYAPSTSASWVSCFNPLRGNPVDLRCRSSSPYPDTSLFQSPTGQSGGSTSS